MPQKPFKREQRRSRPKPFVAYDLETTRIKKEGGTPTPLYITAFSESFFLSTELKGKNKIIALRDILEAWFLTPERNNTRYVAWNGNNFDAYFIAQALLESDDWIIRPYLTRTKALRGIKVVQKFSTNGDKKLQFEFLDGLSMTGLASSNLKSLRKFLEVFAPEYHKLDGPDFEREEFDPKNRDHVAYAERDSEGLYWGLKEANRIVKELTDNELQPTIGNLAIKFFQSRLPENLLIWHPPWELNDKLHGCLKRGGYCWVQRQYRGPVWKYDINQAYAAAMRDCALPAGRCIHTVEFNDENPGVYHVRAKRSKQSRVPFYVRSIETDIGYFTNGAETETWITDTEIKHLRADEWDVEIIEGFYWSDSFNMAEMVNELERLRFTDPKGPSGPLGTMVKMIGNNAYGKTLEQLEGIELVMAKEKPDGYMQYMAEVPEMKNVFFKMGQVFQRPYHQPQLGIFITAHVRLIVRAAALEYPDKFLYADTDCVAFSEPVTHLKIDSKKYGEWKKEVDGHDYIIIGKKVYCDTLQAANPDPKERAKGIKAKGLRVRELTREDFESWLNGSPPTQKQTQRQNFVKFIGGQNMFSELERKGTDVTLSQQCKLIGDVFVPIQPRGKQKCATEI